MATWRVKYAGPCSECGRVLLAGTPAIWDRGTSKMRCVECPPAAPAERDVDRGVAGRSAQAEYERRVAKHDDAIVDRWGTGVVGKVVRSIASEPQTTRAWAIGAAGEEKLAHELESIPGLQVLSDRRVPGSRANIDHIVIAPAGVFVVDAKNHQGTVAVRDRGGLFRTDYRLTVSGRDCSGMADNLAWQVESVIGALGETQPLPPITPVLCFLRAEWPLIRRPHEFHGVRLESLRTLRKQLTARTVLDAPRINELTEILARALPAR